MLLLSIVVTHWHSQTTQTSNENAPSKGDHIIIHYKTTNEQRTIIDASKPQVKLKVVYRKLILNIVLRENMYKQNHTHQDRLLGVFHAHTEHLAVGAALSWSLAVKVPSVIFVDTFNQFAAIAVTVDEHGSGGHFSVLSQMFQDVRV